MFETCQPVRAGSNREVWPISGPPIDRGRSCGVSRPSADGSLSGRLVHPCPEKIGSKDTVITRSGQVLTGMKHATGACMLV